ncbi:MAG: ATP-binding protein, partial [Planctomycetota bacterium]
LVGKELEVNKVKVVKVFQSLPLLHLNVDDMKQVLLNIILTARDAMPRGGILKIVTQLGPPDTVEVVFSDTGQGIPQNELKNLFLPFYTTKEPGMGTGLGLYAVHSAVKRAKGSIKVDSTPGRGATFTISLPLSGVADSAEQFGPELTAEGLMAEAQPHPPAVLNTTESLSDTGDKVSGYVSPEGIEDDRES